ncbi:MAG: nuclear transport factor 2 family protein [Anaerolineales bacterium]
MDKEIHEFLLKHLNGIMKNDIASYHETTSEDLTLYEWWVTPHRIDGLPFHEFMMTSNAERGAVFGAEETGKTRFDLSNLHIQRYGDTAIASYTLLISASSKDGVKVASHNESRVIVKINGSWKVVHVHKSPAYQAPHVG